MERYEVDAMNTKVVHLSQATESIYPKLICGHDMYVDVCIPVNVQKTTKKVTCPQCLAIKSACSMEDHRDLVYALAEIKQLCRQRMLNELNSAELLKSVYKISMRFAHGIHIGEG